MCMVGWLVCFYTVGCVSNLFCSASSVGRGYRTVSNRILKRGYLTSSYSLGIRNLDPVWRGSFWERV